jgi:hypothetical protein
MAQYLQLSFAVGATTSWYKNVRPSHIATQAKCTASCIIYTRLRVVAGEIEKVSSGRFRQSATMSCTNGKGKRCERA